ncbi:hypothetical protein ABZT48_05185 [Streptomyces avermitilis]|uniref:hypothetical protein n=1 Tax=Streptomyces avermitilis TaxID=33903 RepID=UPI0033A2D5E0
MREATEVAHDPQDVLELCRVLLDFTAIDIATEHLLELAHDASVSAEDRHKAVKLLPAERDEKAALSRPTRCWRN